MSRSRVINFRVGEITWERLKAESEAVGCTISDVVRDKIGDKGTTLDQHLTYIENLLSELVHGKQ